MVGCRPRATWIRGRNEASATRVLAGLSSRAAIPSRPRARPPRLCGLAQRPGAARRVLRVMPRLVDRIGSSFRKWTGRRSSLRCRVPTQGAIQSREAAMTIRRPAGGTSSALAITDIIIGAGKRSGGVRNQRRSLLRRRVCPDRRQPWGHRHVAAEHRAVANPRPPRLMTSEIGQQQPNRRAAVRNRPIA